MSKRKIERIMSVRLYFDAFETGIIELDSHERGVYFTLCLRFYATYGRVKDDDRGLSRACNCTLQAYRKTKKKLIELGKISVVNGYIFQDRAVRELASAKARVSVYNDYVENGKRKKDSKKIEKTLEFSPEKPNENIEGTPTLVPVAVGYGAPNGANHSHRADQVEKSVEPETVLPEAGSSAPARESGVGLAPVDLPKEALDALRMIRTDPAVGMYLALSDVQAFRDAITGWREGVFLVDPDWLTSHGEKMKQLVTDAGCRLEPQTAKPKFIAITGGKV